MCRKNSSLTTLILVHLKFWKRNANGRKFQVLQKRSKFVLINFLFTITAVRSIVLKTIDCTRIRDEKVSRTVFYSLAHKLKTIDHMVVSYIRSIGGRPKSWVPIAQSLFGQHHERDKYHHFLNASSN